ncbi:hypothetical protein WA026_000856 [Henosepilachna vigintioctopunctata]|uniref:Uncharacterized protein n=1 Tax=Henosepilachna vigintioctopunctata TaxID=420089 RepID=A0AAW1V5I0_9CUCU
MYKGKKIRIKDDLSHKDRAILCLSEFFGTLIFLFIGCMGCVHPHLNSNLHISFTFGLGIMLPVQLFAHISGGHVNPAVSISAVVLGRIPLIHLPLYIVSQIIGAFTGFGLLKLFMPSDAPKGVCSPGLGPGISAWQGLGVEVFLTFTLLMACGAVWDSRNAENHDSVSLRLGLVVGVLAMAGVPFTGANMNPARSLAPAVINGDWENWWVYWIGPIGGGLLGATLYRFVFSKEEDLEE